MKTVRLIMALHNHQPVGNFDHVFEKACAEAYHPFLDVADDFPDIRMALHYSGSLFEWLQRNDRGLIDRVREGVKAGRFELLGGGFSEPILTMLTDADLAGQIDLFRRTLRSQCEFDARGIWLPERVWEPYLAGVLCDAGVEYTVVDDFHFRCAGLAAADLCGYYLTEDRGRLLRVFSGSEFLRYAIPFQEPNKTIDYLRTFATEEGRNVIVYADDGEKFGLWPETHKHVYEDGWLRRLFELLDENRDWIRFTTFADAVDEVPPRGKVYLPDASYREMTEWVLPTATQQAFEDVVEALDDAHLTDRARPFMRGGLWRNFKTKYVEANQMYARMMEVSRRLAERRAARNAAEARRELYRGQCNCPYWHGVFGGLYMPFLRFEVYRHLLKAEELLAPKRDRPGREVCDFDFDGQPEVKLHDRKLNAYLKPDRGGTLYELDDRDGCCNLTAVMTRRPEAYHRRLVKAVRELEAAGPQDDAVASIHDRVRWKEPGLEDLLHYDRFVRESLIDHFYPAGILPEEIKTAHAPEWGDFVGAAYDLNVPRSKAAQVTLRRAGVAGRPGSEAPVLLSKRVSLGGQGTLDVRYALGLPEGAPEETVFAVELNIGLMAGDTPDRNFFSETRDNLGNLSTMLCRSAEPALGLVDEWLGVEIWVRTKPNAGFWSYPVETVNDSEGGFERVYQGSAVIAWWPLAAKPGEEDVFDMTVEVRHR